MTTTYHPRKSYFSPNRIQLTGKEVLRDCAEDRVRALEVFEYFKSKVDSDPMDDKSKSEMIKALQLSMDANDKKVKLLDMMTKLSIQQDKDKAAKGKEGLENLSFDDFKANK
tara:strand:+ start:1276 stop:1611 length:336 start_codon:yes stop_codon:yes gene_type:complete